MSRLFFAVQRAFRRLRPHAPRTPETKAEAIVIGTLLIAGFLLLLPALGFARREYQDGVRRKLVRDVKTVLEQWNNMHDGYPIHPSGDLKWCGSTADPEDWFFDDVLRQEPASAGPMHIPKHRAGYPLRYCSTVFAEKQDEGGPLASGYFVEATLENFRGDSTTFNTEYNVAERTLNENGRTLYRVCGGTETQCGSSL